jgi:ATP-dependent Clp protease ATP-binding subunit ClpA
VFERFTDRSRRAIVLAQEQARMLNHNYIGTEHLLLGLVSMEDCTATRTLISLEVSPEEVRRRVLEIVGEGKEPPSGHIPFTPRARKVLELSLRQTVRLPGQYLGTGHLLLGLLAEDEGVAGQVLKALGLRLYETQLAVVQEMESAPAGDANPTDPGELPTQQDLVAHAAELAGLYALPVDTVEEARQVLDLSPQEAKARLALFVRFAKAFHVDPVDLARYLLSDPSNEDRREEPE